MIKHVLDIYVSDPEIQRFVDQIMTSSMSSSEKEEILKDLNLPYAEIKLFYEKTSYGESPNKIDRDDGRNKSPNADLDILALIHMNQNQPSDRNVSKNKPSQDNFPKDIVVLHFVYQMLSISSKIEITVLKDLFPTEMSGIGLIEIINSISLDYADDLGNLLLESVNDLDKAYALNKKLISQDPNTINIIKKSALKSKYEQITPTYFIQNRKENTANLLNRYQQKQESIELLFEYYQKAVNDSNHPIVDEIPANPIIRNLNENWNNPPKQSKNGISLNPVNQKDNSDVSEKDLDTLIKELTDSNGKNFQFDDLKAYYREIMSKANSNNIIRQDLDTTSDKFVIAKVIQAASSSFGFMPRTTQILSLILFIQKNINKGRLLQINTGEGKTLIIAMLAAFQALKGKQVDIVTSSENLAIRDSQKNKNFFNLLNLQVGHNIDFYRSVLKGGENVYSKCQILYGTAHNFCANMLQDFRLGKEFCKRDKNFLIVDEVDNMLIDCKTFITKLSDAGYGFEKLQMVRSQIWMTLNTLLFANGGETFKELFNTIKESVIHAKPTFKLNQNQEEIFSMLLDEWIEKAIQAKLHIFEGKNYIVRNKKIVIVDSENTGEMQLNMRWQYGLHEFLEMKHSLKVGRDGFTSLYYSNHRFFSDYKGNLCGLTGTLGSVPCRDFLQKVYSVDMIEVPTFKPKRFTQLPPVLCSKSDWKEQIIIQSMHVSYEENRAVLIIVKNMKEAENLLSFLKNADIPTIDYIYSDEENLHEKIEKINENKVIVATNLAGRGTDIELSKKLEKKGGLHVILGFMPKSLRVEQQAFGRTSRKGNRGDGIMIVANNYLGLSVNSVEQLKMIRDSEEKRTMEEDSMSLIESFRTKDDMFKEFCQTIDAIPGIKQKPGQFAGLSEQWGEFYTSLELIHSKKSNDEQRRLFSEFLNSLKTNLSKGKFANNHIHYLVEADTHLKEDGNLDEAQHLLNQVRNHTGNTHGLLLREAILENNRGNYDTCRQKILESNKVFEKYIGHKASLKSLGTSTSIMNNAVDVMIDSSSYLENAMNNRLSFETPLNNIQFENNEAYQFLQNFENNQMMVIENDDLQAEIKAYEKAINLIESVAQHNQSSDKKIILETKPSDESEQENSTPEIPIPVPKQKKEKKTGFWGYILGGFNIIVGAVLTICSSGLFATFGVGLIMKGIDLININYEMNQNGTYSDSVIIKEYAKGVCSSMIHAVSFHGISQFPIISKIFENVKGINNNILNSPILRDMAIQTCIRGLNGGGSPESFRDSLASEINHKKSLAELQCLKDEMNPEEQQEFVNGQVKEWFENDINKPLQRLNPKRIEEFYSKVSPYVQEKFNDLKAEIAANPEFNVLICALVLHDKQDKQNKKIIRTYLNSKTTELKKKFLNPKSDKRVHQVIEFDEFHKLSDTQINPEFVNELNKILSEISKATKKGEIFLFNFFNAYLKDIDKSIASETQQIQNKQNSFKDDCKKFNENRIGDHQSLLNRQNEMNREVDRFKLKMAHFEALFKICSSDKFKQVDFPNISTLALDNLKYNRAWKPKKDDFIDILSSDCLPTNELICEFFQKSLTNKDSELGRIISKADKVEDLILSVFEELVRQELLNSMK